MKNLRRTKITCTIGPAAEPEEMLTKLINTGMNVARINFSHGGFDENAEKIERIKMIREKLNQPIALCLDTKGPEIRTGNGSTRPSWPNILKCLGTFSFEFI